MHKIITTTTNTLEGWEVAEYLQPISANVVVGSNIFSDISASFTDFFGGRSTSYERKLQEIYSQATDSLKNKAKTMGANCILGLKIDIGEVSGKGTQMFMVSAVGTPVIAVKTKAAPVLQKKQGVSNIVDGALVETKMKSNRLLEMFRKDPDVQFNQAAVDFMVESKSTDFGHIMIGLISRIPYDPEATAKLQSAMPYFGRIEPDAASEIIFSHFLNTEFGVSLQDRLIEILHCPKCERDQYGFKSDEAKPTYINQLLKTRLEVIEELMAN